MSPINDTDLILVERGGVSYKCEIATFVSALDTDILLVERDGVSYQVTKSNMGATSALLFTLPVDQPPVNLADVYARGTPASVGSPNSGVGLVIVGNPVNTGVVFSNDDSNGSSGWTINLATGNQPFFNADGSVRPFTSASYQASDWTTLRWWAGDGTTPAPLYKVDSNAAYICQGFGISQMGTNNTNVVAEPVPLSSGLLDTDLLLLEQDGVAYQITGAQFNGAQGAMSGFLYLGADGSGGNLNPPDYAVAVRSGQPSGVKFTDFCSTANTIYPIGTDGNIYQTIANAYSEPITPFIYSDAETFDGNNLGMCTSYDWTTTTGITLLIKKDKTIRGYQKDGVVLSDFPDDGTNPGNAKFIKWGSAQGGNSAVWAITDSGEMWFSSTLTSNIGGQSSIYGLYWNHYKPAFPNGEKAISMAWYGLDRNPVVILSDGGNLYSINVDNLTESTTVYPLWQKWTNQIGTFATPWPIDTGGVKFKAINQLNSTSSIGVSALTVDDDVWYGSTAQDQVRAAADATYFSPTGFKANSLLWGTGTVSGPVYRLEYGTGILQFVTTYTVTGSGTDPSALTWPWQNYPTDIVGSPVGAQTSHQNAKWNFFIGK